jgi:hypothetical protein
VKPNPKALVAAGLEKALVAQAPVARANVERLRRLHPDESPTDLINRIRRTYLAAITMTGGAAGAAGAVPGAGVPTALADVLAFTEATTLYVLSLAEIHDLDPEDVERRKLLVLTVLLGDSAITALEATIPRTAPYWARLIVERTPMTAINAANRVLGPRFITKYGTKQGVLVLSKQVPLGIGAGLGAGGNHLFGRLATRSARKIFGPPPATWALPTKDGADDD